MPERHKASWPKKATDMPVESEAIQAAVEILRDTHPDADPVAVLFEQATGGKSGEGVYWMDVYGQLALTYTLQFEETEFLQYAWAERSKAEVIAFVVDLCDGSLEWEAA